MQRAENVEKCAKCGKSIKINHLCYQIDKLFFHKECYELVMKNQPKKRKKRKKEEVKNLSDKKCPLCLHSMQKTENGVYFCEKHGDFTLLPNGRLEKITFEDEPNDFIHCQLCFAKVKSIAPHLKKMHDIKYDDYKKQFPNFPVISNSVREKLQAKRNHTEQGKLNRKLGHKAWLKKTKKSRKPKTLREKAIKRYIKKDKSKAEIWSLITWSKTYKPNKRNFNKIYDNIKEEIENE